jgi:two-component system, OmpR family, response regulator
VSSTDGTSPDNRLSGEESPGRGEFLHLFTRAQEILHHAHAVGQVTEQKLSNLVRRQRSLDSHWVAERVPDPPGDVTGHPPRHLHVLLVEDHPDVAASTALLLRYFGHEVTVAGNGGAALEAAKMQMPDAVILDVRLPGMDGCEVARRLLDYYPSKRPLLIAVSGYGGEGQAERCAAAGIERLLLKPVDPDELRLVLR